ncbi:MAG: hypothetical protein HOO67_05570 [Candidatus Peribacteraceae bacterium]|nr:hypothetical protein [Candidatus Peribacteraceae bacterium]
MTVRELIELLQTANPDDEVTAYNSDHQGLVPVTGMLYDGKDRMVELCTDEP